MRNTIINTLIENMKKVAISLQKTFENIRNRLIHGLIQYKYPSELYYIGYNGTVYLKIRKGLHTCELIKVGYI